MADTPKPSLADQLKESVAHMKAIERGEAPPLPVRYPSPDFDPAASEFVFETGGDLFEETVAIAGRAVFTADDLEIATYILRDIWNIRAEHGDAEALIAAKGWAAEPGDDEEPEWMASARAAEEDGMSAEEITAWYVAQEKANPTTLWSVIRGYAFAPGLTIRGRIWLMHHIWKNARALRRMEDKP